MRDPVLWGRLSHPPAALCSAALPHTASWTTHLWISPGSRAVTSDGHTEVPYLSIFTLLCFLTATREVFATRQRKSNVSYQSGVKEDDSEVWRFPRSLSKQGGWDGLALAPCWHASVTYSNTNHSWLVVALAWSSKTPATWPARDASSSESWSFAKTVLPLWAKAHPRRHRNCFSANSRGIPSPPPQYSATLHKPAQLTTKSTAQKVQGHDKPLSPLWGTAVDAEPCWLSHLSALCCPGLSAMCCPQLCLCVLGWSMHLHMAGPIQPPHSQLLLLLPHAATAIVFLSQALSPHKSPQSYINLSDTSPAVNEAEHGLPLCSTPCT